MGGVAALVALALDVNLLRPLPDRPDRGPLVSVGVGAGLGLVVVLISHLLDRAFEWSRALTRTMREALGKQNQGEVTLLAVCSSVGEELLFRGLLLPTIGFTASSIVFGVVHGLSPGPPAHMWEMAKRFAPLVLIATILGFALAWTVVYTGSILAAIVAHFTINFLNMSEMFRDDWEKGGQA
jgi:membrane protease YdiL (CAAX protease family)